MNLFQTYLENTNGKLSKGKDYIHWRNFINKTKTQGLEYTLMNYSYSGKDIKMLEMQKQFQDLYKKLDEYIEQKSDELDLKYKG